MGLKERLETADIERSVVETGIEGASLLPLRVVDTPGGAVMHMLRTDFPMALAENGRLVLGEVYFSEVLPGAVKAWKRHTRQTQLYAVPSGLLGLVLWDDRPASKTRGKLCTLRIGRGGVYALVRIPCGVWYGFTAIGGAPAVICNCPDIPHDPTEGEKAPWQGEGAIPVPFDWNSPFPGL